VSTSNSVCFCSFWHKIHRGTLTHNHRCFALPGCFNFLLKHVHQRQKQGFLRTFWHYLAFQGRLNMTNGKLRPTKLFLLACIWHKLCSALLLNIFLMVSAHPPCLWCGYDCGNRRATISGRTFASQVKNSTVCPKTFCKKLFWQCFRHTKTYQGKKYQLPKLSFPLHFTPLNYVYKNNWCKKKKKSTFDHNFSQKSALQTSKTPFQMIEYSFLKIYMCSVVL
jgi:hypothetical protein